MALRIASPLPSSLLGFARPFPFPCFGDPTTSGCWSKGVDPSEGAKRYVPYRTVFTRYPGSEEGRGEGDGGERETIQRKQNEIEPDLGLVRVSRGWGGQAWIRCCSQSQGHSAWEREGEEGREAVKMIKWIDLESWFRPVCQKNHEWSDGYGFFHLLATPNPARHTNDCQRGARPTRQRP
ncbi:hypothetical protein IE53DRAFT_87986 [Violaceomyces palustris]|uniref:Uncharacterized protein n=1 Tax=Violaceomyces palustris TaxID=1673888 RepID=A0ACD0NXP6_9BASI|nr:hypothetical protein IE53DRAFT_87986 [Violaceomyces palustris]